MKTTRNNKNGFSLVEVLAAVGIIGIIAFLAIPNIVAIKEDSERQLAISRAEAINMGVAAYIRAQGRQAAQATWPAAPNDQYDLIRPYLSYAPTAFSDFQPAGYVIVPPANLNQLQKSQLAADANGNGSLDASETPFVY